MKVLALLTGIAFCLTGSVRAGFARTVEPNRDYTYIYFENGYPTRLTGRRPQSDANTEARANTIP